MHQGGRRSDTAASGSGGVLASFAERFEAVPAAESSLAGIEQVLHQCVGADLGPALGRLDALSRRVEAAKVAVLGEGPR